MSYFIRTTAQLKYKRTILYTTGVTELRKSFLLCSSSPTSHYQKLAAPRSRYRFQGKVPNQII